MQSWFTQCLQPLQRVSPLVVSDDPIKARLGISGALKEHDLVWQQGRVNAALRYLPIGDLSLLLLRYGAAVHIRPGELHDFMLFQVPLTGRARVTVDGHSVNTHPQMGAVISPSSALELDWSEGCEQLLLKVPRQRLEQSCRSLLGTELNQPIVFAPSLDLTLASGLAWQHQLAALLCQLSAGQQQASLRWVRAQEDAVIHHLLLHHDNNYSARLRDAPGIASRSLRLAEAYIREHLCDPITLLQVAQAAGGSARSIHNAFQAQYGVSPMAYVRHLRIENARQALLHAAPGTRVTDIALRWGFTHLGRFGSLYKQRYGESPRQTLAQSRGS